MHRIKAWAVTLFALVSATACGTGDSGEPRPRAGRGDASDLDDTDGGDAVDGRGATDARGAEDLGNTGDPDAGPPNTRDAAAGDTGASDDSDGTRDPDGGPSGTRDGADDAAGVRDGVSGDGATSDTGVHLSPQMAKIDFDISGRPTSEVTEPGFARWPVPAATTSTLTFAGVTYTLAKLGTQGTGLKSTWSKVAVDGPNYARLVGDGVTVEGGDAGAQIQLTIQGLPSGPHTLLTYHNQVSGTAGQLAPVDIRVDGVSAVSKLAPSVGALTNDAAQTAYIRLNANAGQDVVVLFSADMSSAASIKNVIINGLELDTPNPHEQASHPFPADRDEHVDADSGSVTLGWTGGSGAASHDVYVGEDLAVLQRATRSSPLFKGNQTSTSFPVKGLSSMKTYYWRVDEVGAQQGATLGDVWYFRPRQLAFRKAEGYGRYARGGRGGFVVHVTNLNDAGHGSLRSAIEDFVGPRTVVFDVGGIITLTDRLTISDDYITVAGQTAPGKGIVIRGAPFGASGAKDLVLQNIRVRVGGGKTFDGMGLAGSDHAIVDHCSISWTVDDGFNSQSARNITLQRSLISECLNVAGHQNYPAGTAHGYAATIGGDTGSFHHNLLAHCEGHNWSLGGGLDPGGNFAGRLDIFNNVVYNWGHRSTDGGAHEVNFVANYYKRGPATQLNVALKAQYANFPGAQRYFFSQNVMPGVFDESNQAQGRSVEGTPQGYDPWVTWAFFPSYAAVQSASDAYKSVLTDVGATEPVLDDHDVRVVKETLDGTFTYRGSVSGIPGLPDNETDVGGYENYPSVAREATWDSDDDGLPDWWETQRGWNPKSAAGDYRDANADKDGDGFTELDEYLEWMALPHYIIEPNTSVDIDLGKMFAGYTRNVTYWASNSVGGLAIIARQAASFRPDRCGFVSWRVGVMDSEGSSSSKDIVAFVSNGSSACP
jgi:hypothetical protein